MSSMNCDFFRSQFFLEKFSNQKAVVLKNGRGSKNVQENFVTFLQLRKNNRKKPSKMVGLSKKWLCNFLGTVYNYFYLYYIKFINFYYSK